MNNGIKIPRLGLGRCLCLVNQGRETHAALDAAYRAGFRHIDTAKFYKNEQSIGEWIRESGHAREEISVTTKLWNSDHGYDRAQRALDRSLAELNMDYVALYLIHWPVAGKRGESWRALEQAYKDGKARAIGVSNYMDHHLEELLDQAEVVPAVNQIEMHPYTNNSRLDVVEFCREKGIILHAYSPLTKGQKLADPDLLAMGAAYNKTAAQLLIRWTLQKEFVVLPKSSNPERIRQNADVMTLRSRRKICIYWMVLIRLWQPAGTRQARRKAGDNLHKDNLTTTMVGT